MARAVCRVRLMAVAPTLVPRCFSFPLPSEDGVLHIQLLELGRQTFVWLGVGQPALGSLSAAVPLRAGVPAVTDLLGGGEGAALAQRLGAPATSTSRPGGVSQQLQRLGQAAQSWWPAA